MNSTVLNFVIPLPFTSCTWTAFSQDIVFANRYPNGLVVKNVYKQSSRYKFSPVDKPDFIISLKPNEVKATFKANGDTIHNSSYDYYLEYWNTKYVILRTDSLSGDIIYKNIVSIPEMSAKDLFLKAKQFPKSSVHFELISEDHVDFTFQKYYCSFQANKRYIYFTLLLQFKGGRLRYELSDFISAIEVVESSSFMTTSISSKTSTKAYARYFNLGDLYVKANWLKDIKTYWRVIETNINATISNIEKLSEKQEDW